MPTAYGGKSSHLRGPFAEVVARSGAAHDLPENIKYTVRVYWQEGGWSDFTDVVPSNVRPLQNGEDEIRGARVGDPVFISWSGDQIRFGIIEQLHTEDCSA